jgi:3-polyprenyl-4-hydroxybenzoate decarboxylase
MSDTDDVIVATSERVHPRRDIAILAEDQRGRATGTTSPDGPIMPGA